METKKTPHAKKISIGILGIGAIGSALSYYLLPNSHLQIHFYNRSPRKAISIKTADLSFYKPITCETNIPNTQSLDWLLLCLKEHHFAKAKPSLEKLISPKTKIAVIRNGLRLKDPLLPFTKEDNTLECIIDCPCQPTEDGFYKLFKKPNITFPKGQLANEFTNLFPENSITFQQVEDFKTLAWKKLCESSALGGLLAVHKDTCRIFKNPEMVLAYKKLLEEGMAVAKADGAIIEENFVDLMLEKLLTYPKDKGSSMLTDRLLGRAIELGAKNGVIVELGKVYGIRTPEQKRICGLLRDG